jgi:S-adenosylmethionine hydrolase
VTNCITLTTDYGLSTSYVAAVKGQLIRQNPGLLLVDIAHNINKYNLQDAAFVLKNAYHFFPDKTLHLVDVSSLANEPAEFIYFEWSNHHFIMPDNGIASLLTNNDSLTTFVIPNGGRPVLHPFSFLNDVLPAIYPLLQGESPLELFGPGQKQYFQLTNLLPFISGDTLQGKVMYIDDYENIITNIDRKIFKSLIKNDGQMIIHLKKRYNHQNRVDKLVSSYEEVRAGEIACFFAHNNLLEISIRGGKAASLLGLRVDDPIFIEKI